jgi:HD-GYP domain-containing protein (c-di-GMP phosphodiesterase class II)
VRTANIRVAAPMHDIGKIGIPDAILLKPGRLTQDEFRIMRQHTVIGARMLGGSDIPLLNMAREIALFHHEKWDGSGYPNGLKRGEIPIAARIVAIVDVYDAMVHRRVYKTAIPEIEVLDTMARAAGHHFDPVLFDVFTGILPLIRQIREAVPETSSAF